MSNPVREALASSTRRRNEAGYGYFAPNVPGGCKLVSKLHYPDGRIEYELPSVSSAAAGLRIAGLLDNIGRTRYDALREILVKTLAQSIWRAFPRSRVSRDTWINQFTDRTRFRGRKARIVLKFLYAYDFSLQNESAKSKDR